ncbi:hypothetical protein HY091_01480 [Candidatus Kaiserbacteria bacterium]|nr:hypothetical protein [Candidatus Kaiserbacteria bacterium]
MNNHVPDDAEMRQHQMVGEIVMYVVMAFVGSLLYALVFQDFVPGGTDPIFRAISAGLGWGTAACAIIAAGYVLLFEPEAEHAHHPYLPHAHSGGPTVSISQH